MTSRILLVYANPAITATPVSPYGAERVAAILRANGLTVGLCAPWLQLDPLSALEAEVERFQPDLVGFSIRNVDDGLIVRQRDGDAPLDTTFYLPEIRAAVQRVQARGLPVLVGGAAVATLREGLLSWLGVDLGIAGPADALVAAMGRGLAAGLSLEEALPDDPLVIRRQPHFSDRHRGDSHHPALLPGLTPRLREYLILCRERAGRVPVQIAAGCDRRCHFCVEASFHGWAVTPRPVDDIVRELSALKRAGVRRIWLSTSELNVPDSRHAVAVLRAVAQAGLGVDLAGFVQAAPVDDDLLDAVEAAGMDPTALSYEFGHLDDALLRAGAGPANRAAIDRLVERYLKRGYPMLGGSILLGAHPEETWRSVNSALDAALELDKVFPKGFGLAYAAGGRVYAAAPLGRYVRDHLDAARPYLYGRLSEGFVEPLVYCTPTSPRALLGHIQDRLAGARGAMQALNSEAPAEPARLLAEKHINLAILSLADDDDETAEPLLLQALNLAPEHPEALKQLGLLYANLRGDFANAINAFQRLRRQIAGPATAEAAAEIDGVLRQLAAHAATARR